jgi:hypothetical protein
MRWSLFVALAVLPAAAPAPDPPKKFYGGAGWYGVFPPLPGYNAIFSVPVVAKGEKPTEYRQKVEYGWTGGALKGLDVTLARDPAFKKKYAPDALKKEDPAPTEMKVGKHTAWLWIYEAKKGEDDPLVARVVVPLGEDTAFILEAKGQGPWGKKEWAKLAENFDMAKMAEAVKAPPRTDRKRSLDAFKAIKKGDNYRSDVIPWVDHPDKDLGVKNGVYTVEYNLPDGSRVVVVSNSEGVKSVKHEGKDGKTEDLVK